MHKKLKKWLDLFLFMIKPEDSSAGHVRHDYKEEMPQAVNPKVVGALKVLLLLALAILVFWQVVNLIP